MDLQQSPEINFPDNLSKNWDAGFAARGKLEYLEETYNIHLRKIRKK